jgi:hypothetical protein
MSALLPLYPQKPTFIVRGGISQKCQIRTCTILSARSCRRGKRSLRLADCLSQGNFWPSETHRDPSGDKPQHELAGVSIIVWQVISKLDAVSSVLCHDPHFRGWSVCRKAVSVNRQPMSLGKVEEHCRIATCGNDPPGRGIRPEPVLFKMLPPRHTLHSILSIQDVVCSTVGIEHGRRGSQPLEAASGFLATCAIAGGGQNRPADCLQFHFAASAYLGEVVLLFMLHCDRPFVGSVYDVILAFVRNVRNWSNRVSLPMRRPLPVLASERTSATSVGMSQRCQQETHAPQQTVSLFDHLVGAEQE